MQSTEFLNHCRNLFASQADFRNARVTVVEAYASAIEKVTRAIANGKFTIPGAGIKAATEYIRVLAEAVPTEPGVAFLRHGTDGSIHNDSTKKDNTGQ